MSKKRPLETASRSSRKKRQRIYSPLFGNMFDNFKFHIGKSSSPAFRRYKKTKRFRGPNLKRKPEIFETNLNQNEKFAEEVRQRDRIVREKAERIAEESMQRQQYEQEAKERLAERVRQALSEDTQSRFAESGKNFAKESQFKKESFLGAQQRARAAESQRFNGFQNKSSQPEESQPGKSQPGKSQPGQSYKSKRTYTSQHRSDQKSQKSQTGQKSRSWQNTQNSKQSFPKQSSSQGFRQSMPFEPIVPPKSKGDIEYEMQYNTSINDSSCKIKTEGYTLERLNRELSECPDRKVYKRLSLITHTDKNPGCPELSKNAFTRVNNACK